MRAKEVVGVFWNRAFFGREFEQRKLQVERLKKAFP